MPILSPPLPATVAFNRPSPPPRLVVESSPPSQRPRTRKRQNLRPPLALRRHPGLYGGLLLLILPILIWGWQLWVPLGVGGITAGWVYQQRGFWLTGVTAPPTAEQRLSWAIGTGGLITFVLYSALQIWQTVHSFWLAVLMVVQTLAISLLLTRDWTASSSSSPLDKTLADLAHPSALQRLLAIRQVGRWAKSSQRQTLSDCLQLLLQQESEPLVRQAAWKALQELDSLAIQSSQQR